MMAVDAGSIYSEVRIQLDKLNGDISSVEKLFDQLNTGVESKNKKISDSFRQTFATIRDVMQGPVAAIKQIIAVMQQVHAWSDKMESAWEDQSDAVTKLNTILKTTGANAWTSSQHLQDMASALQDTTKYGDETILSMQGILLGFRNITGTNFDEATKAALDMATVMKMDLTAAAQAVGKALDNPTEGMDSLSRQGFKFTKEEKSMMKAMQDAGNIAGAQKIILDELNKTYGGTSEAVANTAIGLKTQLKNAIGDVNEEIGRSISRGLMPFREQWLKIAKAVGAAAKAQNDFKDSMNESLQTTDAEKSLARLKKQLYDLQEQQKKSASTGIGLGIATVTYQPQIDALKLLIAEQERAIEMNARGAQAQASATSQEIAETNQQKDITQARTDALTEYLASLDLLSTKLKSGNVTSALDAENERLTAQDALISSLQAIVSKYNLTSGATVDLLNSEIDKRKTLAAAIQDATNAEEENTSAQEARSNYREDDIKRQEEEIAKIKKATDELEKNTDEWKKQTLELQERHKSTVEQLSDDEARQIASIQASDAETEAKEKAIAAVKEYYALLKSDATEEFAKKQLEMWDTVQSGISDIISNIVDIYNTSIESQIDALDEWYSAQQEYIENGYQTEREALEAALAEALAANDEEAISEAQKDIDLLNLEEEYEKQKAQLEYKANLASWTNTLTSATAQAAYNIIAAWANPLTGPILDAIVTAVNATNLASIIASKPTAPSAATGGIVLSSNGGTLVNTAENGHSELLLNNSPEGSAELRAFAQEIVSQMASLGITPTTTPITMDGKKVAEIVTRYQANRIV